MSIEGPAHLTSPATATFQAFLLTADDQRLDVTKEAQWSSSNAAVLSIDRGLAVPLAQGQTTLQARYSGFSSTWVVTVDPFDRPPEFPKLVIESLSVTVSGPDKTGIFGYLVTFRLRETGGQSSATIGDVVVFGPDGADTTGPVCWRAALRVPPGGTLDTFDTGVSWLGYCAPGSGGRTPTPTLRLLVNFVDDHGRWGSVEAFVTADK